MAVEAYALTFPSGKQYIGIAADAQRRYRKHRTSLRTGSQLAVYRAWRKHGEPEMRVLAVCPDRKYASDLEKKAIAAFGTMVPHGYNLTSGGENGYGFSEETRAKISAVHKGKTVSEKTRARLREANLGKTLTEEQKNNVRDFFRGRKLTEDHKAKIAASHTGKKRKPFSEEHKKKIGEAFRGRTLSDEHKAKISAANMGHGVTPETRARMRAASKRRWARAAAKRS